MKRHLINLVCLLFIAGVIFAGLRFSQQSSDNESLNKPLPDNFPEFDTLNLLAARVELDKGIVAVAVDVGSTATDASILADIMLLYRWADEQFDPLLCGVEDLKDLCIHRTVEIYFLTPRITGEEVLPGEADSYRRLFVYLMLDQIQIRILLSQAPPTEIDQLLAFHEAQMEATQQTGAIILLPDPPIVFEGFVFTDMIIR